MSPPLCPLPLQAAALRWQTHHLAHHPWHLKGSWHRIALNESVFAQRIYAGFPRDTDRSLFFCPKPLTQHSVQARTYQLYSNEIEAPIKIHGTRMCFESRASRLRSHQYLNKSIRLCYSGSWNTKYIHFRRNSHSLYLMNFYHPEHVCQQSWVVHEKFGVKIERNFSKKFFP